VTSHALEVHWNERPGDIPGAVCRQYGYDGWAVLEWECALKHPEDGAREGAPFIRAHMIRTTTKAFDDFAGSGTDAKLHARILGLDAQ
jgi:hypothetical protein